MISLRNPEGSLPSPWVTVPFSMLNCALDGLRWGSAVCDKELSEHSLGTMKMASVSRTSG